MALPVPPVQLFMLKSCQVASLWILRAIRSSSGPAAVAYVPSAIPSPCDLKVVHPCVIQLSAVCGLGKRRGRTPLPNEIWDGCAGLALLQERSWLKFRLESAGVRRIAIIGAEGDIERIDKKPP